MTASRTQGDPPIARFCDQCGRSLQPLDVPHVIRSCTECGKSVYVVEPAEGGGVHIRAGDTFTIPAGWLSMSLDPAKSRGRFFRGGVSWFVGQLLAGGIPQTGSDLNDLLGRYEKEADDLLETSEKLSHLDLDTEPGASEAMRLVQADTDSVEWWAMWMGVMVVDIRERLARGETADAVVSAVRLQAARSMLAFKQQLEDHVWTGYLHAQLIYDVASAAARTPKDAEIIQALRPTFANLSEDVLHAWVEGQLEIGPRIGVTNVDEQLLKALANYHLSLFDRRRREEQLGFENRSKTRTNRVQGAVAMAAIAGAVVTVLKTTGVL